MNSDSEVSFESAVGTSSGDTAIMMSASQNKDEGSYNASTISVSPSQILLLHTNDDTANTVTLDDDGLKYNDSPVITLEDVDELNIIKVNENGVIDKNEITIGSFEIKNDKPYNYTLEGRFYSYDPNCAEGFKVVAHYDQEGVKYGYVVDDSQDEDWYYGFVITDISFEDLEVENSIKNETLNHFLNRKIPILAAYIDNEYTVDGVDVVSFTDDVSEELSVLYTEDNHINDVTFTRSAPFSLKHTSKALLNGIPVATVDNLTVIKGDVEHSAILTGEYSVSGINYSNKAISKTSVSLGAASTAGLKGWYYTSIELDESNNTHIITLSDTQPKVNNGELVGTWTSGTANVKSDDKISIVNNSKFDFCGEVTGYKNNKIRVKGLQFDTIEIPETISRDDFSIYLPEKPDAGIIDFGQGAFSQGVNTKSSNLASHAEGSGTHAYGQYSHTEGRETKAGYGAHAEGRETVASGNLSHAEGRESVASGVHSHAEGRKTIASNTQSHAEGYATQATGSNSHAEGDSSVASGSRAHAEGNSSTASGNQSHAEGKSTIASGSSAHTEGYETEASGIASHAEGYKSQAQGSGAHAEGGYYIDSDSNIVGGIASGDASHAEGLNTNASGIASHAEGRGTIASADYSHAEGYYTTAAGAYSHTSGARTNTTNDYEFACGVYNNSTKDKTLFSVGNGSKKGGVHNAFEITVDGKIYINKTDGTRVCLQDLLGI